MSKTRLESSLILRTTILIDQEKISKKISKLRKLKKGWFYGVGQPMHGSAIDLAFSLDEVAKESKLYRHEVYPGESGDFSYNLINGDHELEFILNDSDCIEFSHEHQDDEICSGDIDIKSASQIIKLFGRSWTELLDFYTKTSGIEVDEDSKL